jgi:hypothetical protein
MLIYANGHRWGLTVPPFEIFWPVTFFYTGISGKISSLDVVFPMVCFVATMKNQL